MTLFGNVDLDCVSYFSVTYKSLNVPGRTEIYIFESRLPYTDDESSDSEISSLNPTKTEYLNFKKGQTTEFVNILKHLGVQITELDN